MLDYVALCLLFFVAIVLFYGIIAIHDIPYEMSVHRQHPHQDAIHVAGWVSLFTLHVLWPFLWIWATLYKPGVGWGMTAHIEDASGGDTALKEKVELLQQRVEVLEKAAGEE